MADKLEEAALSGQLFSDPPHASPPRQRSPSPSGSPSRRRSSDSQNTDDELGADLDDPPSASRPAPSGSGQPLPPTNIPRSTGPGNTGSKGVITDARAATSASAASRAAQIHAIQADQARRAMVAMTIDEEDAARKADLAAKEGAAGMNGQGGDKAKWDKEAQEDALARERWRAQRRAEIERERTKARHADGVARSKMGSVREVGREGFVRAVEREGWVLVLIYEPGIPRCSAVTASLLSLSLSLSSPSASTSDPFATPLPPISLYRARARALRFSLLPPTESSHSSHLSSLSSLDEGDRGEGGEDTLAGFDGVEYDEHSGMDESYDQDVDDEGRPVGRPDPDVLPTLLAYRDGELEGTWVRVDWEVGEEGVEGLLRREGILPRELRTSARGQSGREDDEDDD